MKLKIIEEQIKVKTIGQNLRWKQLKLKWMDSRKQLKVKWLRFKQLKLEKFKGRVTTETTS